MIQKLVYSIKQHTKRAFCGRRFWQAVFITAVLTILDYLPIFLMEIKTIDGITYYTSDILNTILFSGGSIFLGMTFITAVLPYSGSYCEDYSHNMIIPAVKRSTAAGYAIGIVIACALSSYICGMLSQILAACFFGIFVPMDNGMPSSKEIYPLLQDGKNYLFYFLRISLYSLRGAFFGIFALSISVVVKNRYVIYASPFILYYFLMRFGYTVLDVPGYLNVRGVYFDFVFGNEKEILSVLYSLVFTVCMMCLASKWIAFWLRRNL